MFAPNYGTARQVWNVILDHAPDIEIQAVREKLVNPTALLAAIADVESSFGENNKPRYEAVFDKGGKYYSEDAYKLFGEEACCSYGVWQIMGTVLYELGMRTHKPSELTTNFGLACSCTVLYLNRRLPYADNIRQVGDGYNSGSYKDDYVPAVYIKKLEKAYLERYKQVLRYCQHGDESILNS